MLFRTSPDIPAPLSNEALVTQVVRIENVSKYYGAVQVLRGCNLAINRGEVVVICGPSGSGKSTLVKTINGLEPIQSGRITVDDIDIGSARSNLPRLRSRAGMVFQSFELFQHLTVLQNLLLAQEKVLGRGRPESEAKARDLLARVALQDHAGKYPTQLSGGQQQRVAIARALCMDPMLMLFDEPTSALDPEMINEVLDVMTTLAGDGMTMVVVTHEMNFARKVADRVVFMDKGEIVEDGPRDAFFSNPQSIRARDFLAQIIGH
ncbi:MAG: hypothetical protein C0458_14300 [Methylobacterium sp.]|nr:hypothetical protein [Methylobacterium sp.]